MKIKEVVKTEEVIEREIALPLYYRHNHRYLGAHYVKVLDEDNAVIVSHEADFLAHVSRSKPESALSNYPMHHEISKEEFEDHYFAALLTIKEVAAPEYILNAEDKDQFQHQY